MLLERGAPVGRQGRDGFGRSLLSAAVRGNNRDAAELALLLGADLEAADSTGETPLIGAAGRNGGQALVELFIAWGADVHARTRQGKTALHDAALNHQPEAVRLLLERGADVSVSAVARSPGVSGSHSGAPLHMAMLYGSSSAAQDACIQLLVAAGADPRALDEEGLMPAHLPPYGHRSPSSLRALLELLPDLLDARDVRGWTPLHHALHQGATKIAEMLLERGADADAEIPSTKRRAIHVAAEAGYGVKMLLDAGAEPHPRLKNGRTPLMIAADKKNAGAVQALIAAGAELDAVDQDGLSALVFAVLRDRERVVRPLMEAGASADVPVSRAKTVAGRPLRAGDTARRVAPARMLALIEELEAARAASGRSARGEA